MTGRHSIESKRRNHPYISFGSKTKAPWHAEFHTDFVGQTSPPSTRYSPMMNNVSNQRSVSKLGAIGNETKFRQPVSVTKLKENLPVQYADLYEVDSVNNGFKDVLMRVNGKTQLKTEQMSADLKKTYKQVTMGFGKRSDFTKLPQQQYDPGFVYDQNKITSIASRVSKHAQNTEKITTFGSSYKQYDKSMVGEGLQHWTGRGPACDLGNDGNDMKVLKKRNQTIAQTRRDRGLLIQGSVKDQKSSRQPGPGMYDTVDVTSMAGMLNKHKSRRSPMKADAAMSKASRDFSFAKFSGSNSKIYTTLH